MRDWLPEDAANLRAVARILLEQFELFGYRLVIPPAFELAHVIERGLDASSLQDVLRFIEPESGSVAVLRPDMTPQIARIVATRLRQCEPPYRLAYEGTVVRRRAGRAKKHWQVPQVGVELCAVSAPEGDLELLELAAHGLRAVGLEDFTIDVSDAGVVRALTEGMPAEQVAAINVALYTKDEAQLDHAVRDSAHRTALMALVRLHGRRDALVETETVMRSHGNARAHQAAQRLLALFDAATARGLGPVLTADAGDVKSLAYYTGTTFAIYTEGPGEPIGSGGRYDQLLAQFATPMPAVGFGFDLDALLWALRHAQAARAHAHSMRDGVVVVAGEEVSGRTHAHGRVAALRGQGVIAVLIEERQQAIRYAQTWGLSSVWDGASMIDAHSLQERPAPNTSDVDLDARSVARMLEDRRTAEASLSAMESPRSQQARHATPTEQGA